MLPTLSTSTPASEVSSASFDDGEQQNNATSLDDIMRNSPAAKLLGLENDLPEEDEDSQVQDETAEDSTDEDAAESEKESDEAVDDTEEGDENAKDDEESTPNAELPTEEDIDWTYKLPVKIDGKVSYVTLEEVRKGYATDQHLTSKGRQLADERKEVEQLRETKLKELVDIGAVVHEELLATENTLTAEYNRLSAEIEKAKADGDTYAAREAKEAREDVQEKYWKARNSREQKIQVIATQLQEQQVQKQQELLKAYGENITKLIPDYSDKVAKSVREFAIKEGIPEQLLESVYDPAVVKFINDYRKLKTARDSGEVKRKAAPTVKSVPTKNGTPQRQKEAMAEKNIRAKVLSGQGTTQDGLDFLKRISSVSKKL